MPGEIAIATLPASVKYPIPSPKRLTGIISVAIVLAAVFNAPQPNPWINLKSKIKATVDSQVYDTVIAIKTSNPDMKIPFLPSRSSPTPMKGLTSKVAIVKIPLTQPTILSPAPKFLIWTGKVGVISWKPKKISRLINVTKRNCPVQS